MRRELIDPKIAEHRGRIVKTTGDGLLGRVRQRRRRGALRRRDPARRWPSAIRTCPTEKRIEFRIGINLGDVIVEGDDIFGDGVNVAARLEALAEPGGICVSRVVRDQVRDKLDFTFEDLGEQQVKNIARPVRVYRVRLRHRDHSRTRAGSPALAAPRQAVDRGAALRQYERRPGAGIFRRRHGRGDHHRAVAHPLALRHRPQFELHLQRAKPST